MNKRMAALIVALALIILAFGAFGFFNDFRKTGAKSGDVISVTYNPNQNENGSYIIEVKAKYSQKYTIDATGYMNSFSTPQSQGNECVKVPLVKVGDKVSFKLPTSESDKYDYIICYQQGKTGYYFNVD